MEDAKRDREDPRALIAHPERRLRSLKRVLLVVDGALLALFVAVLVLEVDIPVAVICWIGWAVIFGLSLLSWLMMPLHLGKKQPSKMRPQMRKGKGLKGSDLL